MIFSQHTEHCCRREKKAFNVKWMWSKIESEILQKRSLSILFFWWCWNIHWRWKLNCQTWFEFYGFNLIPILHILCDIWIHDVDDDGQSEVDIGFSLIKGSRFSVWFWVFIANKLNFIQTFHKINHFTFFKKLHKKLFKFFFHKQPQQHETHFHDLLNFSWKTKPHTSFTNFAITPQKIKVTSSLIVINYYYVQKLSKSVPYKICFLIPTIIHNSFWLLSMEVNIINFFTLNVQCKISYHAYYVNCYQLSYSRFWLKSGVLVILLFFKKF